VLLVMTVPDALVMIYGINGTGTQVL
jgi:hypothetical protein